MKEFAPAQADALIGATEKMIELWIRLSPEKQKTLLARFGTPENALAAMVTTRLLSPANS